MKPQIFISAVSRELGSVRQQVANALTALGYEPIWQDIFETSADDLKTMLRKKIDGCKSVIQIVGDAYGAEPSIPDNTFGRVSYTQYEALHAKAKGKPVYYLIAQHDAERDECASEIDVEDVVAKQESQRRYKTGITQGGQIFYPIRSLQDSELTVYKLKTDLEKTRSSFQQWMLGTSLALAAIVLAVCGLMQSQAKVDQNMQSVKDNVITVRDFVLHPEQVRAQMLATVERAYDRDIAIANEISDWEKRQESKDQARERRDQKYELVRVDLARI